MATAASRSALERAMPWVVRVLWLAVAAAGVWALGDAVDGRDGPAGRVGAVAGWSGWGLGVGGLAVASTPTLTAFRAVAPAAVPVAATTMAFGAGTSGAAFTAVAAVTAVAAFNAEFGRAFVQGSAYGAEYRFPLKPPIGYAAAAIASWVLAAALLLAGVILLAAQRWAIGGALVFAGAGVVAIVARRWHQLARRWVVKVPAGLVVHDPVVMADTVMIRGELVGGVALVADVGGAADLSGPTPGPYVRFDLTNTVTAVYAPTRAEPRGRAIHLSALAMAPSRPGSVVVAWTGRSEAASPPPTTTPSSRS